MKSVSESETGDLQHVPPAPHGVLSGFGNDWCWLRLGRREWFENKRAERLRLRVHWLRLKLRIFG